MFRVFLNTKVLHTFALDMRKSGHILISLVLSIAILLVGTGINVIHCAHSGAVKVMANDDSHCRGMSCGEASRCMTVEHIELSPTYAAHNLVYNFQAMLPLVAACPDMFAKWLLPAAYKPEVSHVCNTFVHPPRAYLKLIKTLLI